MDKTYNSIGRPALRVSIPEGYRFTPSQADGNLTIQDAAGLQHPAISALRAAMGWHEGRFDADRFRALLHEEDKRITGTWEDYKKAKRAGSFFCLDRRTRGAIYVAVKTTRVLNGTAR